MRRFVRSSMILLLVAGLVIVSDTAFGAGGERAVVRSGTCSGPSRWRLTLTRDDGRLETEIEVHSPTNGQRWRSTFSDNGNRFAVVVKTTSGDGSFSASRLTGDRPGSDTIRVRSKNLASDEVCLARGTF